MLDRNRPQPSLITPNPTMDPPLATASTAAAAPTLPEPGKWRPRHTGYQAAEEDFFGIPKTLGAERCGFCEKRATIRTTDLAESASIGGCMSAEGEDEESARRGPTCRSATSGFPRLGCWSEPAESSET